MRVLALSGGKDAMACLHLMLGTIDMAIYVDTGFAYPETLEMVEYARGLVPVRVVQSDRRGQNEQFGVPADVVPINWTVLGQAMTSPKAVTVQSYMGCCYQNIAKPLWDEAKREGATEIIFGERADENHKSTSKDGDVVDGIRRLHPIEAWSEAQVLEYLATKMTLPAHYAIKHSSLDCYDCTAFRADSADRVQWTKERHQHFYDAYAARAQMLDSALREAINA